ncbi:MFS transporter [Actinomadura mexicana]|uniref:Fucose permease n=1 Tax=Actinomadura mexicana TaxID=134959 RepID=A0A238WQK7_9ACTN|nr:MFS transporter [Actinomadura mexicana]SNR48613.1 Fucose permease [Actinomadura mexicana]
MKPAGTVPARTRETLGLYAAFGCLGYLLTALGAILPELREERGLPRAEAALYPSAFALGLVIVGLTGHRPAARLGRCAIPAALTALVGGAALLAASGGRLGTAAGALVLGLGGAGLVQLVPAALGAAQHGDGTIQIGEANAVSSAASVLSPILIGAALAHGLGWRPAFAAPPLLAAAALLLLLTRPPRPVPSLPPTPAPAIPAPATPAPATPADAVPVDAVPADASRADAGPAGAEAAENWSEGEERRGQGGPGSPAGAVGVGFRGRWVDLVLAVGVEFCMVFWAADFLGSVKGLGSGGAATLSAGFVLGMAVGRSVAGPVVRRGGRPDRLLALAAAVGIGGFVVLWASPAPVAVAGLVVTGLGVALLYPVILGQALAARPSEPVRAAARCALASGVAIGVAPLALGTLADLTTLRAAVLVAPVLLLVLLARCGRRLRTGSAS